MAEKTIIDYLQEVVDKEYNPGELCKSYDTQGRVASCFFPNDRNFNMQRIMELLLSDRCHYLPLDLRQKLVGSYEHEQHMNHNPRYIPTERDYQITGWLQQVRSTVASMCFTKEQWFNQNKAKFI